MEHFHVLFLWLLSIFSFTIALGQQDKLSDLSLSIINTFTIVNF